MGTESGRPQSTVDKAEARDAISKLIFGYAEAIDGGDLERVGEIFAHAVIRIAGRDGEIRGARAVRDMFAANTIFYDEAGPADPDAPGSNPCTRHCVTNLILDVDDDGRTARSRSYVIVFQARPGFALQPVFRNRYLDAFECVDGRWRFCERVMELDEFQGDTTHHLYRTPRTR